MTGARDPKRAEGAGLPARLELRNTDGDNSCIFAEGDPRNSCIRTRAREGNGWENACLVEMPKALAAEIVKRWNSHVPAASPGASEVAPAPESVPFVVPSEPPTPKEMDTRQRATRALKALDAYHGPTSDALQDLLADLRHLADLAGLDYDEADRLARAAHQEERRDK